MPRERRLAFLRTEGIYLSEAWKSFRERLPRDEQAEFAKRAPSIVDVIETIRSMSAKWETKRKQGSYGTTKRHFHKLCDGLNAHQTMLEVLPAASEYVSLFAGVLKSVIRASANHERIAAGLARSFGEITDAVGDCARLAHLYDTEDVQMLVANLYAHIFLFLKDAMAWYLDKHWKRVLHSFREDFYDAFADQASNIKAIAAQVQHRANVGLSAEQRITRLAVEDLRMHTHGSARKQAELEEAMKRMEKRALAEDQQKNATMQQTPEKLKELATYIATHMFDLLETQAAEWQERRKEIPPPKMVDDVQRADSSSPPLAASTPPNLANRETYLMASRGLELHFDRDQIQLPFESSATVTASIDIVQHLQSFAANSEQYVLAIAGPQSRDHQGLSTTTKVAASFVNHATEIGLPLISWFCAPPSGSTENAGMTREWSALVSLLYALIRQLIELLPLKPKAPIDVDIATLESLNGCSTATIDATNLVLKDLLAQLDTTLFIVIDGLEWLDDTSTHRPLTSTLQTLINASAARLPEQSSTSVRILLTTTGRSHALLDVLEPGTYLLADGGRGAKIAGGHRIAW